MSINDRAGTVTLRFASDTSQVRADMPGMGKVVRGELAQMGSVGKGAFAGVLNEITNLERRIPLVGQPLAGITRELFKMGTAKAPIDELAGAFKKFQGILAQVSAGKNPIATDLFKDFGIDADKGLRSPSIAFAKFREEFRRFPDEAGRARIAADLFGADASKLIPVLEGAEGATVATSGAMTGAAVAIGVTGAAVVAAVGAFVLLTAGVYKAVDAFVEYAGKIHDLGQENGLAAETLSTIDVYARLAGTGVEKASASIDIYLKNLAEAAHGNPQAAKTFERFGIDAKKSLGDTDKATRDLFDTLGKIPNSAERLDAAYKLAGKSGKVLALIADEMSSSFADAQRRAEELGVVLSQDDVDAADRFSDAWETLKMKGEGAIYSIAREALPELTKAIDEISAALGSNLLDWQRWGLGVAIAIARTRGVVEGAAKWWMGNTWSPWQLGKDIGEGADSAEFGAVLDSLQRRAKADGEKHRTGQRVTGADIQPRRRGGGGKDRSGQQEQRELQNAERDELDRHRQFTQELKRAYDRRIYDLDEYVRQTKEELDKHYNALSDDYDKEEALIKKTYKKTAERNEKLGELSRKRNQTLRDYERERTAVEDESADKKHAAVVARAEGLARVYDAQDRSKISAVQRSVELQTKLESDAAKEIGDIQLRMNLRAAGLQLARLNRAEKGSAEYKNIQTEMGLLEIERGDIIAATTARITLALKAEADARRELLEQVRIFNIEVRRMEIEADAGSKRFPSRRERLSVLHQLAEQERDLENERHKQKTDEIARNRKIAEQTLEDTTTYDRQLEAEKRRHKTAMQKIDTGEDKGKRDLDPFGGIKDRFEEWKNGIKNSSESVRTSVANLATDVFNIVPNMTAALGQAAEANILYGESIGLAMKKALAAELAHVSAEAWIESLRHAAWAVGSLAFGNFGAAARHAAAAAGFAALAAVTGKAAGSLAQSAGMRGASTASGSATSSLAGRQDAAGGAGSSAPPNNQTFNYGGNFSTPSSEDAPGSRGNMWSRIEARIDAIEQRSVAAYAKLDGTLSRIDGISPGSIVRLGAPDAHEEIGIAVLTEQARNDGFSDTFARQGRFG